MVTENSSVSKQNVYHYLQSKELSGNEKMDFGIYTRRNYIDDQFDEEIKKEKPLKGKVKEDKDNDDLYY